MRIEKEGFGEMIKKINKLTEDAPLLFNEKGIMVVGMTCDQAMMARCFLPINKIKDYKPIGIIGANLTDLSKFIGRFTSLIELETDLNILSMVEGKKEAKLKLLNPDFIDEGKKELLTKDFEFGEMFIFDITSSLLKQTIDDITAVSRVKDVILVRFDIKGKELTIDVSGSENNLKRTITLAEEVKEPIHGVYDGELIRTLLSMITADKIKVYLKNDYPLKVTEHTKEDIDVFYILAPRLDDQTEEEIIETEKSLNKDEE